MYKRKHFAGTPQRNLYLSVSLSHEELAPKEYLDRKITRNLRTNTHTHARANVQMGQSSADA